MGTREEVKHLIAKEGLTITEIAKRMTEMTGKKYTLKGLSDKLARKTLRLEEFLVILKILNYEIRYKKLD